MNPRFYIFLFIFTIFALAGCVPTRNLQGNEKLLYDVELTGIKQNDPEKIVALYRQKPNRKIPVIGWTPYLSVYYFGKSLYKPQKIEKQLQKLEADYERRVKKAGTDSTEIGILTEKRERKLERLTRKRENGNWLMRSVGEPPAIYDSVLTVETVSQINTYLNSKGYFHNKVNYSVKTEDKKVYLTLNVTENAPFTYSEISYNIPDPKLKALVLSNPTPTPLTAGQHYDEERLVQERDRIEQLLRNQGYFEFRKQFITFDVDTSFGGNTVRLETVISNPSDSATFHKQYTLRKVFFVEDAGLNRFGVKRDTLEYKQVNFLAYNQWVSPKVLRKKLRIAPGQLYSMQRTNRTQRQVTDLDVYRFVAVNYVTLRDSLEPRLDAYVNVMPAKRFQETTELGGNFNFYGQSSSSLLPLPYGSLRLKVRNIFGSAENLEMGVRLGLEGQPSTVEQKVVTTTEIGGNVALYFPQFLIPFYRSEMVNLYNPRTRINTSFTYTNREDYTRTNTELSLDYFWQRSPRLQFVVSPADINLVNVQRISDRFLARLEDYRSQGFPLIESFKTAVVSSVNGSMIYNSNNINQTLDAKYFKLFLEIGNVPKVLFGADWIPDWVTEQNSRYRSYSFAKINADYRRYFKLKEKSYFVARFNAGIASPIPYNNDNILPYDRFFFSGGGSSVRAWRPRKLGPGSFTPDFKRDENDEIIYLNGYPVRNYDFEQPGEILLESNAEYRFNIFSYLNGALFVDAGNVWTIKPKDAIPGGEFSRDFLTEVAVGTGFGLRFDFSFLIIRFDIATKVLDPAEAKGDRFVFNWRRLTKNTFSADNTQNSFNLGIGYPF